MPYEKQAICLNPTEKDEDFLNIILINPMTGDTEHKFTYEIDSLK